MIGAKWRVDSLLGSGSMAAVYAVTHRNGARAALKILHPTLCADAAVCERFLGEGYLTNSVKHPGIVRVLDDGLTDDGCVFLVMDLLEGETLDSLRERRGGRLPVLETLDLADKLMDVLAAVHQAGIIHRDLKPQNVFLTNDGMVKLLDFGVARLLDQRAKSNGSLFGVVLGTPSFMSPEQALGARENIDHRSDVWSLGALLFTALTGETVHLGANVQARLLAAATVRARSIGVVMPELPPPIASAIDVALRFQRDERWQTVDAFRRALKEARVTAGLASPSADAPRLEVISDEPSAERVTPVVEGMLFPPSPPPARSLRTPLAAKVLESRRRRGVGTWLAFAVVAATAGAAAAFVLFPHGASSAASVPARESASQATTLTNADVAAPSVSETTRVAPSPTMVLVPEPELESAAPSSAPPSSPAKKAPAAPKPDHEAGDHHSAEAVRLPRPDVPAATATVEPKPQETVHAPDLFGTPD